MFVFVVLAVAVGSHLYLGWRLAGLPGAGALGGFLAWGLVGAGFVTLVLSMVLGHQGDPQGWIRPLVWSGYVWMGFLLYLVLSQVTVDVGLLGLRVLRLLPGLPEMPLDTLRATGSLLAVLASLGMGGVALWNGHQPPRVREVEVEVPDLPPAFQGLRVAWISDTHVGVLLQKAWTADVVERINALHPDLVVHTGDLADGRVEDLREHVEPFSRLRAPLGLYYVTGNHEAYSGLEAWTREARRLGFRPLLNEHVVLEREGQKLVLAGVTDRHEGHADQARHSDPVKALAGAPADAPRILLAHQPASARDAQDLEIDLLLSGHTHGGQFWPFHLFIPLQQPLVAGEGKLGTVPVLVSNGTGFWGPPLRLFAPSEIVLVKLARAEATKAAAP